MYHTILYFGKDSIKQRETKNVTRRTNAAITIQSNVRRLLRQSRYRRALAAILQIQYCARKYIRAMESAKILLRDDRAATLIQKNWRMYEACKLFHSAVTISVWCQRHQRGNLWRIKIKALKISRNLKSDEPTSITLHSDDETVNIPKSQAGEATSSDACMSSFSMFSSKIPDEMKSSKMMEDFSVAGHVSAISVELAESTLKLKALQIENDRLKKQINMLTVSETTQDLAFRDAIERIRNIHNEEKIKLIQEQDALKEEINQLQNDIHRLTQERDTIQTKYLCKETKVVGLTRELHTMKQKHQAKVDVSVTSGGTKSTAEETFYLEYGEAALQNDSSGGQNISTVKNKKEPLNPQAQSDTSVKSFINKSQLDENSTTNIAFERHESRKGTKRNHTTISRIKTVSRRDSSSFFLNLLSRACCCKNEHVRVSHSSLRGSQFL